MNKHFLLVLAICLISFAVSAQKFHYLPDQPGTFEFAGRGNLSGLDWGFTKAEVTASVEEVRKVADVLRQNPVLSDIKGFNCRAVVSTPYSTTKGKDWYGVPSILFINFLEYFMSKEGKIYFNTIEPPNWQLCINDIASAGVDYFSGRDGYFTVPLKKKTIEPGIDVYDDELWVLYDPARPPYWIPVTLDEAFASVYQDIKNDKNELNAKLMKEMVDNEYAAIPEADRKNQAYYGGNMSRVSPTPGYDGQDNLFPYVMKANPEYWNRDLPKSAIQIIWLNSCQTDGCKQYIRNQLNECLDYPDNGAGCDVIRFNLAFGMTDIRNLATLIGK